MERYYITLRDCEPRGMTLTGHSDKVERSMMGLEVCTQGTGIL